MIPIQWEAIELTALAPLLTALLVAVFILLWDAARRSDDLVPHLLISLVGAVVVAVYSFYLIGTREESFQGIVIADNLSLIANILIMAGVFFGALLGYDYLVREGIHRGEYFALLFFSASGMMVFVSAQELVAIFLGLELLSIPLYLLCASHRRRAESQEAAIKYFLLGAITSAFFLLGIALIYGSMGTTRLQPFLQFLSSGHFLSATTYEQSFIVTGITLLIIGLAFKMAVIPFHMWTPDAYEGAPIPAVAFMASTTKVAPLALFIRLFRFSQPHIPESFWLALVILLAVLTMTLGNIFAIPQTRIKRLMAYSTITHVGYILVGVIAGNRLGLEGVLFYLITYLIAVMGVFGIIFLVSTPLEGQTSIYDYSGLHKRSPLLALAMTIFLLSLAGIPPTAGFFAKWYVFAGAMEAKMAPLVVIALVNSVVSVYYYLKVITIMYMGQPGQITVREKPALLRSGEDLPEKFVKLRKIISEADTRGKKLHELLLEKGVLVDTAQAVEEGEPEPVEVPDELLRKPALHPLTLTLVVLMLIAVLLVGLIPGPVAQFVSIAFQ